MSKVKSVPKGQNIPRERRTVVLHILEEGRTVRRTLGRRSMSQKGMENDFYNPLQRLLGGSESDVARWVTEFEADPKIDKIFLVDMRRR